MFAKIYEIYEKEITRITFACRAGCAACCTQSVTMTTAEGKAILAFLAERGRRLPPLPDTSGRALPVCTTNGLAACCLAGREPPPEPESPWFYEPCVFLKDGRCTVYPVRPFGCRSFGSTSCCAEQGVAEVPEWLVGMNTTVNQLMEDLDRPGFWGNMLDVLDFLARAEGCLPVRLLPNQPLPGLLLGPDEEAIVRPFWERLVRAGCTDDRC